MMTRAQPPRRDSFKVEKTRRTRISYLSSSGIGSDGSDRVRFQSALPIPHTLTGKGAPRGITRSGPLGFKSLPKQGSKR